MKISLHHILFCFCLVTASVCVSYAQDSGSPDYQVTDSEDYKMERDKVLYSPGEGDTKYLPSRSYTVPLATPKDSVAKDSSAAVKNPPVAPPKIKPGQPAKAAEKQQQSKDDDSILSFNFLYYIIQKYKLQDVID